MHKTLTKYLLSKGYTTNTVDKIYQDVLHFIEWCEAENIASENATTTEILSYVQHIKKRGVKQKTVKTYLISIKHYFTWLIKRELRTENPVRTIEVKGIKRQYLYEIIKQKELETLYEQYEIPTNLKTRELTHTRNKILLGLMIWQGLKAEELAKLTVKNLKLRTGEIEIEGTKKSNPRTLKLSPSQILDLMEYTLQVRREILSISGETTEKLFIGLGGGASFGNMMRQVLKQAKKQNNKITSAQQIRASVITHWLKNYNLREVQEMAGHRYVSSTEAYLVNDLDGLQEEITKYHPF